MANVLMSVAEWERETIGQRTREGMAAARAKGGAVSGPSVADRPELVVERIRAMRASGMTAALALAGPIHREEGGAVTLAGPIHPEEGVAGRRYSRLCPLTA